MTTQALYWIAINGSSCARLAVSLRLPLRVTPTPQILIGFLTAKESLDAQQTCLTAPIEEVKQRMSEWHRRVDVTVIRPANPGPQTNGETLWAEL